MWSAQNRTDIEERKENEYEVRIGFYKDEDNMTVWQYPYTEEVMEVVSEFRAIQRRRQMKQMNWQTKMIQ